MHIVYLNTSRNLKAPTAAIIINYVYDYVMCKILARDETRIVHKYLLKILCVYELGPMQAYMHRKHIKHFKNI